jgi:hypothetical protein
LSKYGNSALFFSQIYGDFCPFKQIKFPLHTRHLILFLVMLVQEFAPQKQEKTLLPSDDHPYQDGAKLYINLA